MTGKAPSPIETERLVLRRPRESDAPEIFDSFAHDSEVTWFLAWATHATVADTRAFLAWSEEEWQRWPAGPYLILSRTDLRIVGSTGLAFETPHRASTGYVLARREWGKGYATEALSAVVELARGLGVARLAALCHTEHRASARVLDKCGFACEGILKAHTEFPNLAPGRPCDVLCYARVLGGGSGGPG